MKSNTLVSVERINRGPTDRFCGIDWGSDRLVLVMLDGKELWWKRPGSCWNGIGMPRSYVPGELILYDHKLGYSSKVCLQRGGRLSRLLVVKHAKQLMEFFDFEDELVVFRIKPDRTLTRAKDLKRYHEGKSKA